MSFLLWFVPLHIISETPVWWWYYFCAILFCWPRSVHYTGSVVKKNGPLDPVNQWYIVPFIHKNRFKFDYLCINKKYDVSVDHTQTVNGHKRGISLKLCYSCLSYGRTWMSNTKTGQCAPRERKLCVGAGWNRILMRAQHQPSSPMNGHWSQCCC